MPATKPVRVGKRTFSNYKETARAFGVPYGRFYQRVTKCGMSPAEAVKAPLYIGRTYGEVTFQGKKYPNVLTLCRRLGISYQGVLFRMRQGSTLREAVMRSRHF